MLKLFGSDSWDFLHAFEMKRTADKNHLYTNLLNTKNFSIEPHRPIFVSQGEIPEVQKQTARPKLNMVGSPSSNR